MTAWTIAPLAQVLTQEKQYVTELEPRSYPKLSVKLYGRGAVLVHVGGSHWGDQAARGRPV